MRFSFVFLRALWTYKKNYVPLGQSGAQKIEKKKYKTRRNLNSWSTLPWNVLAHCHRKRKKKEFRIINPEISFHKANRM